MKKILITIMLLFISVSASAEFTEAKYQELVDTKHRIETYRNIQLTFQKTFATIESNLSEILKLYQTLPAPNTDIDQDTIDEMQSLYNALKNGASNIKTTHRVFLTGDDGVE